MYSPWFHKILSKAKEITFSCLEKKENLEGIILINSVNQKKKIFLIESGWIEKIK